MDELYIALAAVALLTIAASLARVAAGPTRHDRVLGVQLIGSCGVSTLLLLAEGLAMPALHDVALVLALLAAVLAVAFVRQDVAADTQDGRE